MTATVSRVFLSPIKMLCRAKFRVFPVRKIWLELIETLSMDSLRYPLSVISSTSTGFGTAARALWKVKEKMLKAISVFLNMFFGYFL